MVDYVNEDHGLDTIQHNFSCEAHGKGIHDAEGGVYFNNHCHLFAVIASLTTVYTCATGVLGGDKTDASSASIHGKTIDTANDLIFT